jgi:hypothetical protein
MADGAFARKERSKTKVFQGGMAMQKYEAQKHVNRHLEVIQNTKATKETNRWRDPAPTYAFAKQKGKIVQQEQAVNIDNSYINKRLVEIVAERRSHLVSDAYLPGWRVAQGKHFLSFTPLLYKILSLSLSLSITHSLSLSLSRSLYVYLSIYLSIYLSPSLLVLSLNRSLLYFSTSSLPLLTDQVVPSSIAIPAHIITTLSKLKHV